MVRAQPLNPALKRTATVAIVGGLAVVFGTTIVSVAIRPLVTELHSNVGTVQWVSTGHLLAIGMTIPTVGWAQGRLGSARLWMIALGVFLIASILCSVAWDAPSLIAFRVVQGIGGGAVLPMMSTLVVQAAKGADLGRVISAVSLAILLGPILGPVLGGIILNGLTWRWLFVFNIPFCVADLVLAWFLLPKDGERTDVRLDAVGFVLLSPALAGILYGLSMVISNRGFASPVVLVPLVGGVVLLAAFVLWTSRKRSRALIDLGLLRNHPLATSSALLFLSGIALYGAMLLLPLYWQEVREVDALDAGLLLIPQGLGTFLTCLVAGRLTDRFGARWVSLVGFVIVAIGTVPFALANGRTDEWWLMAALLVRGAGLGAVTVPLTAGAFLGLSRVDIPQASIITRIATQLGGSFGVAILAVILQTAAADQQTEDTVAASFDQSFWWAVAFPMLGAVLSVLLPKAPRHATPSRVSVTRQLNRTRRTDRPVG